MLPKLVSLPEGTNCELVKHGVFTALELHVLGR
jgi:hypothetical protein